MDSQFDNWQRARIVLFFVVFRLTFASHKLLTQSVVGVKLSVLGRFNSACIFQGIDSLCLTLSGRNLIHLIKRPSPCRAVNTTSATITNY
jgi:hypothetical protein